MNSDAEKIALNVTGVRDRIARAASECGRNAGQVTLVAVTKYVGSNEMRALMTAGCFDLAESRPQQLWKRAEELKLSSGQIDRVRWHLVGHLQRNKVRRTLPLVSLIHSCDSLRLIQQIDETASQTETSKPIQVLLEVNISGDAAKHGFTHEVLETQIEQLAGLRHIQVQGLMGMASLEGGRSQARRDFAKLRQLRDRLLSSCPERISLAELSMGMSGDFEEAILEGATIVRIGSVLFEGIQLSDD